MKLRWHIIIGLLMISILILSGCTTDDNDGTSYIDVTPAEAKELINNTPELIIIDVSPNYENGHLPGAVNYYIGDESLDEAIPTLDKTKPYLVYCHVDSASISGAQKLIDAGFTTVYRLEGNYQAWLDAGYQIEIETEEEEETSYIDVTPAEAKELINNTPEIIIIDVSPNYAQGHIPGAVNYYIGDGSLDEAIPTLDKTKPYLVYCHVDSASIGGAQKLIAAGFTTVYRLEGNYQAWVDAGYQTEP